MRREVERSHGRGHGPACGPALAADEAVQLVLQFDEGAVVVDHDVSDVPDLVGAAGAFGDITGTDIIGTGDAAGLTSLFADIEVGDDQTVTEQGT